MQQEAKKLAGEVKRNVGLTGREKHIISVTEKILTKLESGDPLLLTKFEAYRVSSRKGGNGARDVIRAVLMELGVDVSSGYRKIATMRK